MTLQEKQGTKTWMDLTSKEYKLYYLHWLTTVPLYRLKISL